MKKIALCLALVGLLALGGTAIAEICTIDDVPASTLLLPYFEVNLDDAGGQTTLFSINNASASAAVAHITFWTDESIPTLDYDVYLTGYDVQTINIRDVFNGFLSVTADDGADPLDLISPQGDFSQDINFPGSTGPCIAPYSNPVLNSTQITHLRNSHTGLQSPIYGSCPGFDHGDNIARGYITVDSVTQCNLSFPSDAGYFSTGIADDRNILWGDYFYVDPTNNFAQGETLVHIESCSLTTSPLNPECPFTPGDYTFYGRYAAIAGQDQREPLATTFATRFLLGGGFDGGTDLIVWRDSKTAPTGANNPLSCASSPAWFPLAQTQVVAFDEQENPEELCILGDIVSPPTGGVQTCFPLETQRVAVGGGNIVGTDPTPTFDFGWIYLNLNFVLGSETDPFPGVAQNWVTTVMSAEGRYSVGFDAIQLQSACTEFPGGLVIGGGL
jgi:hypothetical protein